VGKRRERGSTRGGGGAGGAAGPPPPPPPPPPRAGGPEGGAGGRRFPSGVGEVEERDEMREGERERTYAGVEERGRRFLGGEADWWAPPGAVA
jgi:hypothetical protein